jgi:two-component system osmolarity sensor histidine kinase EnvZ
MAPTDLAGVIRDLVARYTATSRAQIDLILPPDMPALAFDRQLIERALDNLLSNASRYGTAIRVSLRAGPDTLDVVVEDDGPGIAPRDRARATEPFVRLDAARNQDHGGGLGLGLAIVSEVATAHRGALVLDESPDLGGLRATLRLPSAAGAQAQV